MSANTHSIWKDPSEEASLDSVVLRVCEVSMPGRYQEQERGGCLDLFSAASLEVEVTFFCHFFLQASAKVLPHTLEISCPFL